jgi:hypothetical protein
MNFCMNNENSLRNQFIYNKITNFNYTSAGARLCVRPR